MSDDSDTERLSAILEVQDPNELHLFAGSAADGDLAKPLSLLMLAEKLRLRFKGSGLVDDIDLAIASGRRAVELSENVPPILALALGEVARASVARFEHCRDATDFSDIEEAMSAYCRLLELTPDDDPRLLQHTREYAASFVARLEVKDDIDTLREACTWSRCAVELAPDTHEGKPRLLYALGGLLLSCFSKHTGSMDDLHEAILVLARAAELTPLGLARTRYLDQLKDALCCRFDMQDPRGDAPLAQYAFAVNLLPPVDSRVHRLLVALAQSYDGIFVDNQRHEDDCLARDSFDMSIAMLCRIVELERRIDYNSSPGALETNCFGILVSRLRSRLQVRWQREDTTLSRYILTLDIIPEDHPEKPLLLVELAERFRERWLRDKNPQDYDDSIAASHHALRLDPDSAGALRSLGLSLVARGMPDGDGEPVTGLDDAIPLLQRAANILLNSSEADKQLILVLAHALSIRFRQSGSAASDVDDAVALLRRALTQLPDGHDDIPLYLVRLANALVDQFRRSKKIRDVEDAIREMKRALDLLPSSSSDRPKFFDQLGNMLWLRSEYLQNYEDLVSAANAHRESMNCDHANPLYALKLAGVLVQCTRARGGSEVDEAIDLLRAIIKRNPLHGAMQIFLGSLGNALILRFELHRRRDDLDAAIAMAERSLSLSAGNYDTIQDQTTQLHLSICYFCRFHISNSASDLEEGIRLMQAILPRMPFFALRSDGVQSLVRKLILRLEISSSPQVDHLRDARDEAHRAIDLGGPIALVEAALQFNSLIKWADLLPEDERRSLFEDATEQYRKIILLLPQVAWLGDDIARRFDLLSGYSARNIVGAAVAHALEMGDVTSALEWFEQGRAVVWTQIHGLRTPVDKLRAEFPDLASRLQRISQALENSGRQNAPMLVDNPTSSQGESSGTRAAYTPLDKDDITALLNVARTSLKVDNLASGSRTRLEDHADERRLLAEEYRELLEEIRRHSGFKDFLLPRSRDDLSRGLLGHVACINIHDSRCDALILSGSELHHVRLQELTPDVAQRWQQTLYQSLGLEFTRERKSGPVSIASNGGLLRVLRRMWAVVVKPIFEVLRWTERTDTSSIKDRHIKWCTRGSLAFLPLHAAGPYDGSSPNAFDIAVSSYTSTIAALLSETERESTSQPSILVVAQENAAGGSRLPGTKKECAHIRALFSDTSSTFLVDEAGIADSVRGNMGAHPYIHLACHGRQGVADPMSSAFLLHDGELTLHKLMEQSSSSGELAFLSACETSKGHGKLPDEAVHLAAGMLALGYRSVVGTMWSINDRAAPDVAREFYKNLLQSRAGDGRLDVAYALHTATQALRYDCLKEKAKAKQGRKRKRNLKETTEEEDEDIPSEEVLKMQDDDSTLAIMLPSPKYPLRSPDVVQMSDYEFYNEFRWEDSYKLGTIQKFEDGKNLVKLAAAKKQPVTFGQTVVRDHKGILNEATGAPSGKPSFTLQNEGGPTFPIVDQLINNEFKTSWADSLGMILGYMSLEPRPKVMIFFQKGMKTGDMFATIPGRPPAAPPDHSRRTTAKWPSKRAII